MSIISKNVLKAQTDLTRLSALIDEWTNSYLELLGNVAHTDLVFQEGSALDINFVALCCWDDPSNLVVLQTIPPPQTEEVQERNLAMTSVIAATLYDLGHFDVAVVLLADDVGKVFRHEGIVGHSRTIPGCSRVPTITSHFEFSAIPGHVARSAPPAPSN